MELVGEVWSPRQPAFRFQNESECNGRKPKLWPFSALAPAVVRGVRDNGSRPDPFSSIWGSQGVFAMFRGSPGRQTTDKIDVLGCSVGGEQGRVCPGGKSWRDREG